MLFLIYLFIYQTQADDCSKMVKPRPIWSLHLPQSASHPHQARESACLCSCSDHSQDQLGGYFRIQEIQDHHLHKHSYCVLLQQFSFDRSFWCKTHSSIDYRRSDHIDHMSSCDENSGIIFLGSIYPHNGRLQDVFLCNAVSSMFHFECRLGRLHLSGKTHNFWILYNILYCRICIAFLGLSLLLFCQLSSTVFFKALISTFISSSRVILFVTCLCSFSR